MWDEIDLIRFGLTGKIKLDTFTPKKRSWVMSRIRSGNTKPEMIVRSFLHHLGFRFSLRTSKLPGKPDIVLKKYNTVVFVHGCFWHLCTHCKGGRIPKSNLDYWKKKLVNNKKRDEKHFDALVNLGWEVLIVWECETKREISLRKALKPLLNKKKS
jgi:DNA mismatch endonuclease, patch repair protein